MEKIAYHNVPRVIVKFTQEDLEVLWVCSETHYDGKVKSLSREGGKLWGMRNMLGEASSGEYELSQDDLDTMMKALENHCPRIERERYLVLHDDIHGIWLGLRGEYRRLNPK